MTSSAGDVERDVVAGEGGVRATRDSGTAEEAEAEGLDGIDIEVSAIGVRGPSRFISWTGRRVLTPPLAHAEGGALPPSETGTRGGDPVGKKERNLVPGNPWLVRGNARPAARGQAIHPLRAASLQSAGAGILLARQRGSSRDPFPVPKWR